MLFDAEFEPDAPVANPAAEDVVGPAKHFCVTTVGIIDHGLKGSVDSLEIGGGDVTEVAFRGARYY
jgi:hypothetical protein